MSRGTHLPGLTEGKRSAAYVAANRRGRMRMGLAVVCSLFLSCCGGAPDGGAVAQRRGIITLAPHLTEAVFALGQGHRVIAVSSFCDYPPEISPLPRVGGYIDPDLEKITLLSPELLIVPGKHEKMMKFAELQHIAALSVNMDSIETVDSGIAELGRALGCPDKADALRAKVRGELDAVRASVADKPRKKVFIVTGRTDHNLSGLFSAGGKSFVSQVIDVAGGDNIFRDANENYFEASKEQVVMDAPEVIIEFHAGEKLSEAEQAAYVADWAQLPSIPAVKEGRIVLVLESYALRPGPRVGEVARIVAAKLNDNVKQP